METSSYTSSHTREPKGAFLWDDPYQDQWSWKIKWTDESTLDKDWSVHLIYHDPNDLRSLILIRIISKERTPRQSWILNPIPWILDSTLFHWNLNSRFHSLLGFRIPKPRIPDSTRKNFTDSGIRIPLQGAIHRFAVIYARIPHARLSQRAFWN